MAVLLQLTVSAATRDQFDDLVARVEQAMEQAGGPPAGLMSHVVYPDDSGFVLADVWRTSDEARLYVNDVLGPLTELGLETEEAAVRPVWSFARP